MRPKLSFLLIAVFGILLLPLFLSACTNSASISVPTFPTEPVEIPTEESPVTSGAVEEPVATEVAIEETAPANSVTEAEKEPAQTKSEVVEPAVVEPPASEPVAAESVAAGELFVRRNGTQLFLDGTPFRFVGTNAFFLQPETAYENQAGMKETLDKAVLLGMNVIRLWAFNDKSPDLDRAAIQTAPGEYNESNLVALDQVIAEAKVRNLRVILPLVNHWTDYGGIERYVEWCNCGATKSDFYTNETMKGWYRNYATMLVNRVNTVTGIAYRDEPTILAWELGNELRDRGQSPDNLLAWHVEMARFLKSIAPNQLIADGGEGYDSDTSLYSGLTNTFVVRGTEGASYHRLAQIPEIDMLSYHLYPEPWGLNLEGDVTIWIEKHEAIAKEAGKVAYLGEFGLVADDTARASIFLRWLNTALIEQEGTGALVWGVTYDARPNRDGFNIYCPTDRETCAVLESLAEQIVP